MSTQQEICAVGSENRPPMLNKDNCVPWSYHLLRYAKSKPNEKLIYNSIMNGACIIQMIPEPGDPDRYVPVAETFHEQTNEELTEKEVKQMKADDQAIQTILMGLPKDIYAAVDSCETAQEIWLRVQQIMKGSDIGIQEKKAKLFNEWERFNSTKRESIESYYHRFSKLMNDFKKNKHFPEKIANNLKFLNNLQPEWSHHVTIVHQTKDLHEFTLAKEQYTELLDPIPKPHQVQQNDSDVIFAVSSVEQNMGTIEQHPATAEETRALYDSLYNNLATKVETVNRFKRCTCFHLKPDSFFHTTENELLGYQNPFYLKQAQQKQQSLYNGKVLLEKHDPPAVYDSEETLQLAQESRLKMKQLNKEIKPANYAKINHLSEVFVSQKAKSREELYFSNTSKTATVSKSISIPNEEFSRDDFSIVFNRKFSK
ncbi:hypothetical protein Tco_0381958 [Tanacetum coccineum]